MWVAIYCVVECHSVNRGQWAGEESSRHSCFAFEFTSYLSQIVGKLNVYYFKSSVSENKRKDWVHKVKVMELYSRMHAHAQLYTKTYTHTERLLISWTKTITIDGAHARLHAFWCNSPQANSVLRVLHYRPDCGEFTFDISQLVLPNFVI